MILGSSLLRGVARSFVFRCKMTGTVKTFNPSKGFGFIIPADGSTDVFVHQTSIQASGFRSLAPGEEVEYDVEEKNGKHVAINVTGPGGVNVRGSPPPRRDFDSRAGGDARTIRKPRGFGKGEYSD